MKSVPIGISGLGPLTPKPQKQTCCLVPGECHYGMSTVFFKEEGFLNGVFNDKFKIRIRLEKRHSCHFQLLCVHNCSPWGQVARLGESVLGRFGSALGLLLVSQPRQGLAEVYCMDQVPVSYESHSYSKPLNLRH